MKKNLLTIAVIIFSVIAIFTGGTIAVTITKGLIGKQDISLWDGTSTKTFTRTNQDGYTLTLNQFDWAGVDVFQSYGAGASRTKTSVSSALSAAGTSNRVPFWYSPGTWTIDDDLTITENITSVIPAGVLFNVSSGKTLTINGPIQAGAYRIFSGDGTVELNSNQPINVKWFLTADQPDGSTDNSAQISSAISALPAHGGVVYFPSDASNYVINDDITSGATATLDIPKGAILSVSSTKTLTINGLIEAGSYTIFTGSGKVKIGTAQWQRPVEWFGALGDGSTNDYTAFLNALISCSIQAGGGEILINTQKQYVLNNGSDPAIELDRDTLPDGTDASAWDPEDAPIFMISGTSPPVCARSNKVNEYTIKVTGTGDGISITGGTALWRGQLHFKNFIISGNATADDGILIDYMNRYNTFENIGVINFTGDGIEMLSNNTFTTSFRNVISRYNGGWGFIVDGNAYDFYSCSAEYNGTGGVKISTGNNVNWYGGAIQYNNIPQIEFAAADYVNFDGVYIEGQTDVQYGSSPTTGTNHGIIEVTGNSTSIRFSGRVNHSAGTDTYKEQYLIDLTADVYGLELGPIESGLADYGAVSVYIVGDIGANTLQQATYNVRYAAGAVTGDFETTATRDQFNLIFDRTGRTIITGEKGTRLLSTDLLVLGDEEQALTANSATPSISNYSRWKDSSYTGAKDVTDLLNEVEGQIVIIRSSTGYITLKDASTTGQFYLPGGADKTLATKDVIVLQARGSYWYCLSYSDNS